MSASFARIEAIPVRTSGWSSTHKTRIVVVVSVIRGVHSDSAARPKSSCRGLEHWPIRVGLRYGWPAPSYRSIHNDRPCRSRSRQSRSHRPSPEAGAPWTNNRAPPRRSSRPNASDRKSTRLNSSHVKISYAVFCLKKKKIKESNLKNKKKKKKYKKKKKNKKT